MRKIFIVLFVLLSSVLFAETNHIYDRSHQINETDSEEVSFYESSDGMFVLNIWQFTDSSTTWYKITSKSLDKMQDLLVKLENNISKWNYINYLVEQEKINENKHYKLTNRKVGTQDNKLMAHYAYEYN